MGTIKTYDGEDHPVTDDWFAKNVTPNPALVSLTEAQHENMRKGLLNLSNKRQLSAQERQQLSAITNIQNVNRAWRWLAGRHYNEFGFTHLDQVHGNKSTHICGCQTQHVFDHNLVQANANLPPEKQVPVQTYPHHLVRSCPAHEHLAGDYVAHSKQVYADAEAQVAAIQAKAAAANKNK